MVRADLDYIEVTPEEWAQFEAANFAGEEILDRLRGRQVWIDHGRGVVTRYAHLSAIAEGIAVGVEVQQNQVIGNPGESGQQEVYLNPGTDIHLHFEIRIGDGWLGQGESPETGRLLYCKPSARSTSNRLARTDRLGRRLSRRTLRRQPGHDAPLHQPVDHGLV